MAKPRKAKEPVYWYEDSEVKVPEVRHDQLLNFFPKFARLYTKQTEKNEENYSKLKNYREGRTQLGPYKL